MFDEPNGLSESRDPLNRAHWFLNEAMPLPPDERIRFEIYLDSCIIFARSAMHRMDTRLRKAGHSGWLKSFTDPADLTAVEFFRNKRDRLLKEAASRIGQTIYFGDPPSPPRASDFYYYVQDERAVVTVERYLGRIRAIIESAARNYIF
jgi:hypothetical protein